MTSFLGNSKGLADFDQKSLASMKNFPSPPRMQKLTHVTQVAAASIAFNPIFWK
jgi:hypothetical protein